jgi:hypothetical protein
MHDVPFPSSAKKAELVELFKEHISPNSANLLAAKEDSGRAVPDILDAVSLFVYLAGFSSVFALMDC